MDICPADYIPQDDEKSADHWTFRWKQVCLWSTYDEAKAYWESHADEIEGLCFINHHGCCGSAAEVQAAREKAEWRIAVVDADDAFDEQGSLYPELSAVNDLLDTYSEYSKSRTGVHWFLMYYGPMLNGKQQHRPFDHLPTAFDILFNGNTAFTGDLFPGSPTHLARVGSARQILTAFHVKPVKTGQEVDLPVWWSSPERPLNPTELNLVPRMQYFQSIEGQGGDMAMFSAACELMRYGVTGWPALRLLQEVPADPPWNETELKHKVEEAFRSVHREGRFGDFSVDAFGEVDIEQHEQAPKQSEPEDQIIDLGTLIGRYKRGELKRKFIVEGALQDMKPTVIVGEKKCLKTSIAMDLVLSLETGRDFLGQFKINERRRTLYFGAETDSEDLADLTKRILAAKQEPFEENLYKDIKAGNFIPPFHSKSPTNLQNHLINFRKILRKHLPQVVIFDPLYLGMPEIDLGNLFEVGGALNSLFTECKAVGAWLIMIHHAKRMNEFRPITLNDIYGSGMGEWAGQWMLLSRQKEMEHGQHKLYLRIGGRAGDFGLWDLTVNEGEVDALNTERRWDVSIERIDESAQEEAFAMKILQLIPIDMSVKMAHFEMYPYPRLKIQHAIEWLVGKKKITAINGLVTRCDEEDTDASIDLDELE